MVPPCLVCNTFTLTKVKAPYAKTFLLTIQLTLFLISKLSVVGTSLSRFRCFNSNISPNLLQTNASRAECLYNARGKDT